MFKGLLFFLKQGWKYDKKYIIWRVLYQFINAMIPVIATIMPKFIIDELMGGKDIYRLLGYVSILVGYTFIASLLSNFFSLDGFTRRCKVAAEFDSDLHRRLCQSDYERLEDPKYLDMKEKAKKFLYCDWHGFGYLFDCALTIIGRCITLVGISVVVVTLDWRIAIAFVAFVIISAMIENAEKKKAMKLSREVSRDQRGWNYYANLFEDANYGKEIRMNAMGQWLLDRERNYFKKVNGNLGKQNAHYMKAGNWGAFFSFLQQAISYGYLIVCAFRNRISIGSFTMYVGAIATFASSMKNVISSLVEIQAYDMYYDDLDEYLSVPTNLRKGHRKDVLRSDADNVIEFKNVSFQYPGSDYYALKNVNLTLAWGKKLSVVGENGAGKTTFVKLLTRLYDPTEGEITLNGVNINEMDYEYYMSLFSTVYQDYKLFSLSIKENVALGLPIDDTKIQSILESVGFGNKISTLPLGIETSIHKNLDEEGFEPSGGEGQKIALARAIYKNAPFVVLDEPTAALDPRAEYELYQQFNNMVDGKTAVYISHRLSSSKFCDVIAVFSQGEIVEYGAHDDLIAKNGYYKELFDMQAQFYV